MTIEKAIDQLDWYFQVDDGCAVEPVTKEAYETLKRIAESKKNVFDNAHSFKYVIKYGTISQPDGEVVGMIHASNRSEAYEILKERTFKRLYDPLNMNRTVIEYGYLKEY